MTEELIDADGSPTPLTRAVIISIVMRRMAIVQQPIHDYELFAAVLEEIGLAEEQAGCEIREAIFWLARSRIILASNFNYCEESLRSGGRLWPSKQITGFIWGEPALGDDEGEAA